MQGRLKIFLFLIVVSMLFGACDVWRKSKKEPIRSKKEGAEYLVQKMEEHQFDFQWLSTKFQAKVVNGKRNMSFSGYIRMRRDSAIWMTLSPALGIEAVRLLLTPDSVKVLDRINKKHFAGNYDYINKNLGVDVDFSIMQAILLGNDFESYDKESFKASLDGDVYRLSSPGRRKIRKQYQSDSTDISVLVHDIWLDPENFKIIGQWLKIVQEHPRKIEMNFGTFLDIDQQKLPTHFEYSILGDKPLYIDVNYSRIQTHKKLNMPFRVPSKYAAMHIE